MLGPRAGARPSRAAGAAGGPCWTTSASGRWRAWPARPRGRPPGHELERVHHPGHVEALAALGGQRAQLDADTSVSPGSWPAALLAAGGAVAAVRPSGGPGAQNAFVWARPPGHHAERHGRWAFACSTTSRSPPRPRRALGAERVLIVDWDVHHGNGTQHIFERRRDVLFMSTHQYPFYPGTGAPEEIGRGEGAGYTVNCALARGQTDADYGGVQRSLFLPIAEEYRPSWSWSRRASTPHARDPLGEMRVTERGFAAMCTAARRWPRPRARPPGAGARGRLRPHRAVAIGRARCLEVLTGRNEEFPAAPRAPRWPWRTAALLLQHTGGAWPLDGSMPDRPGGEFSTFPRRGRRIFGPAGVASVR